MARSGSRIVPEFQKWAHRSNPQNPKVVSLHDDNLVAHFVVSTWNSQEGKKYWGDVYHTVEKLLDFEQCFTCNKDHVAFPDKLDQIIIALNEYKGKKDIPPLSHDDLGFDGGFYVR